MSKRNHSMSGYSVFKMILFDVSFIKIGLKIRNLQHQRFFIIHPVYRNSNYITNLEISTYTIAIITFWTSFFCHIKKNSLKQALLKLSHMIDEILVKFIYNSSMLFKFIVFISLFSIFY
jgi:hypothetical protein